VCVSRRANPGTVKVDVCARPHPNVCDHTDPVGLWPGGSGEVDARNTLRAVRSMLERNGFRHCVYGYQSDPAHFGFSRILYAFGVLHQRIAPGAIKPAIFAFAERLG
jgi:hypothetical protein